MKKERHIEQETSNKIEVKDQTCKKVSLRLSLFSRVRLVNVRNSSEFPRSRFQVSDSKKFAGATGFEPVHVQIQQ